MKQSWKWHTSLLQIFHWPEFSHIATFNCKQQFYTAAFLCTVVISDTGVYIQLHNIMYCNSKLQYIEPKVFISNFIVIKMNIFISICLYIISSIKWLTLFLPHWYFCYFFHIIGISSNKVIFNWIFLLDIHLFCDNFIDNLKLLYFIPLLRPKVEANAGFQMDLSSILFR